MNNIKKYFLINSQNINTQPISKNERIKSANFKINIDKFLEYFISSSKRLIRKRKILKHSNKTTILIFYYMPSDNDYIISFNENEINTMSSIFGRIDNIPVEIILFKLTNPHLSRYVIAQYLRLQTKKNKFNRIKKDAYKIVPLTNEKFRNDNGNIISYMIGIKIKISGRLITERTRPQITVSTATKGSFIKRNNKTLLNERKYTVKNYKGALTVSVKFNEQIIN